MSSCLIFFVFFSDARYLSPELLVLGPKAHPTAIQAALLPCSAVWSFGIVLLEILQVSRQIYPLIHWFISFSVIHLHVKNVSCCFITDCGFFLVLREELDDVGPQRCCVEGAQFALWRIYPFEWRESSFDAGIFLSFICFFSHSKLAIIRKNSLNFVQEISEAVKDIIRDCLTFSPLLRPGPMTLAEKLPTDRPHSSVRQIKFSFDGFCSKRGRKEEVCHGLFNSRSSQRSMTHFGMFFRRWLCDAGQISSEIRVRAKNVHDSQWKIQINFQNFCNFFNRSFEGAFVQSGYRRSLSAVEVGRRRRVEWAESAGICRRGSRDSIPSPVRIRSAIFLLFSTWHTFPVQNPHSFLCRLSTGDQASFAKGHILADPPKNLITLNLNSLLEVDYRDRKLVD